MKENIQTTTYLVVNKLLRQGFTFSFALGFADACVTENKEPELFDERVDNLQRMGIDIEEFCRGFQQYKTMEEIKSV